MCSSYGEIHSSYKGSSYMESLTVITLFILFRKMPIQEFHFDKVINELEFTKEQVLRQ